MAMRQNVGSAAPIRAVQEFFGMHGRCREVQLADGLHYPVLLSIEQLSGEVAMLGRGAIDAGGLRVRYRGRKEDLIALGCISRDRLARVRYGRYENDPRGALLHVERKATPGRRRMIELSYLARCRSFAGMLPGVRTYCADWLEALTSRPMLRLVVDNGARGTPPACLTSMDRAVLLKHLAQAERHVADGEQRLIQQRAIIQELEEDGHDTGSARALLTAFEEAHALHVADRERLRAELTHAG